MPAVTSPDKPLRLGGAQEVVAQADDARPGPGTVVEEHLGTLGVEDGVDLRQLHVVGPHAGEVVRDHPVAVGYGIGHGGVAQGSTTGGGELGGELAVELRLRRRTRVSLRGGVPVLVRTLAHADRAGGRRRGDGRRRHGERGVPTP